MQIESLAPMLRSWDMPRAIAFYESLGFTCADRTEAWAVLTQGGTELMLSAPNPHEGDTAPAFTGSLYFRIGDVDAVWEAAREKARVCYPIETFGYGMREFAIYDPDGYLLQFGQAVD